MPLTPYLCYEHEFDSRRRYKKLKAKEYKSSKLK